MLQDKSMAYDVREKVSRAKDVFLTSSATVTTYQMGIADLVVRVTTDGSNAITVTLPPVSLARGNIYTVILVTDGGVNLTLEDFNGDAAKDDLTFADVGDMACLYSDGYKWYLIGSVGL